LRVSLSTLSGLGALAGTAFFAAGLTGAFVSGSFVSWTLDSSGCWIDTSGRVRANDNVVWRLALGVGAVVGLASDSSSDLFAPLVGGMTGTATWGQNAKLT
jgi:hypothetical protein